MGEFIESDIKEIVIRNKDGMESVVEGAALLIMLNTDTKIMTIDQVGIELDKDIESDEMVIIALGVSQFFEDYFTQHPSVIFQGRSGGNNDILH